MRGVVGSVRRAQGSDVEELQESATGAWATFVESLPRVGMRRTLDRAIEAVKTAFDAHGIEMPSQVIALQATSSLAAALRGDEVTPGGNVANGHASR